MNAMLKTAAVAVLSLSAMCTYAAERASPADAQVLVKKAASYLAEHGKEKAFAEFNNTKGQFIDRDLYIFVYDMKGLCQAIGNGNAGKMVGKDLSEMRDTDGVPIIKKMIEQASTKGSGSVDYRWPNPVSKTVEMKTSYVQKVGDVFVGAGAYKPLMK